MGNQIVIVGASDNRILLDFINDNKDIKSRLSKFTEWLDTTAQNWYQPDLRAYRDELLARGLSSASINANMSSIRSVYKRIIRDNATRDWAYSLTSSEMPVDQRKSFVDELLTRLENSIHPSLSTVKVVTVQDHADSDHLRLSSSQANALLSAPGLNTLKGLRDTSIIALLLCTGIREAELCALDVDDLSQTLGGDVAIRVAHGKGDKQRLVPLGDLDWCLVIVQAWLKRAGITDGAVFRSLKPYSHQVTSRRLLVRQMENIIAGYSVVVNGEMRKVRPHDCRRTYARRMYEAGMALASIQQNLGHSNIETTLGYIGTLDASQRRGKAVYTFDLSQLTNL